MGRASTCEASAAAWRRGRSASWIRAKRRKCAVVSASFSQDQLSSRRFPSCVRKIGVKAPSSVQRMKSSLLLGPPEKPATSWVTFG